MSKLIALATLCIWYLPTFEWWLTCFATTLTWWITSFWVYTLALDLVICSDFVVWCLIFLVISLIVLSRILLLSWHGSFNKMVLPHKPPLFFRL
jgi:hypothetical protein